MVSLWVGRVGGASPGGHSPGANPNPDGFKKAADGAAHRSAQAAPGASPKVCIRGMPERKRVHYDKHVRMHAEHLDIQCEIL